MSNPESKSTDKEKLSGIVVGGGTGAFIIKYANTLENDGLKEFLIYLAPTLSMILGVVIAVLTYEIKKAYKKYRVTQLKIDLEKNLNDSNISPGTKEKLQVKYDEIAQYHTKEITKEIKTIMNETNKNNYKKY